MKRTRFVAAEGCGLRLREAAEGEQESRVVEGAPIVFGVRSVNLTPWSDCRVVYEVLEPGCISAELLERSDVVLNLNHSNYVPDVLGRCRNGKGTLTLELGKKNVRCSCELPHTGNADDTLELLRRGDISGMSFAFEDDWEDTENGVSYERTDELEDGKAVWLRHVKRITALHDVSIVTHPAYEQTGVAVREAGKEIDAAIEAAIKREAGEGEPEGTPEETPQDSPQEVAVEEKADEGAEERERVAAQRRMCQRARMMREDVELFV